MCLQLLPKVFSNFYFFLYYQTIFYKRYKVSSFPIFVAAACCSINCYFILSIFILLYCFICLSFFQYLKRDKRWKICYWQISFFYHPTVETKTITSVISWKWFEDCFFLFIISKSIIVCFFNFHEVNYKLPITLIV